MPPLGRRVNHGVGAASNDDAQRKVQRTTRADERAGQLEISTRLDEEPALLLAEAEEAELVVAPAGDPLVLGGQLVGWRKLGCGHICCNDQTRAEFVRRT